MGLDREQVVDAAVDVLVEQGRFPGLADVAGRLGIRTQSLYAHVDGVDGLRRQLALRGLAALTHRLTDAAMGRAGADAVEAIVLAWVTFAAEQPKDKPATKNATFDAISALTGTWVAVGAPDGDGTGVAPGTGIAFLSWPVTFCPEIVTSWTLPARTWAWKSE